jgi:hypothetical protein
MRLLDAIKTAWCIFLVGQLLHLCSAEGAENKLASKIVDTWNLLSWRSNTILNMYTSNIATCISISKQSTGVVTVGNDYKALGLPWRPTDAHSQITYITIFVNGQEDQDKIMHIIKMSRGNSVLLVMMDTSRQIWESTNLPLGFFVLYHRGLELKKVITSRKGHHLVKDVTFQTRPQRDIAGAALEMVTLTYAPYLHLHGCNETSRKCPHEEATGWLKDTMDTIAPRANYSYELYQEESGIWGVDAPGPNQGINASSGVFRAMLEGHSDLPLSAWTPMEARAPWADLSFGFFDRKFNCFVNGDLLGNHSNLNFLSSPFSILSWIVLFAFIVILEVGKTQQALKECKSILYREQRRRK